MERVSMLCPNNFVIVGVSGGFPSLVDRVLSKLTGLKVRDIDLSLAKAVVAVSDENCILEKESRLIVFYGVFLGENPHSLFSKLNNFEVFSKEYRQQGVVALFDIGEKTIRIIGDPAGTRSVFYFATPDAFIISTDMKLLKDVAQALGIQFRYDVLALYEIMVFGYIVSRRTIFENVHRMLPGEILTMQVSGGFFENHISKYWDSVPANKPQVERKLVAKLIGSLVNRLDDYCEETPGSEIAVPVSGGIDSSLLLLLASKAEKCRQLRAIHVNLENPVEFLLSKLIIAKTRTRYHRQVFPIEQLRKNYIRLLSNLLEVIGYPREGDVALPYLILAHIERDKGIRFSIGGDGADSIYGGHDYYKFFATQLLLEKRIPDLLRLIKILGKYNYNREKQYSIILRILVQFAMRFYPIRYQYIKLRLHRRSSIQNKRLNKLIAQYLAELSNNLYDAPAHDYYHEILGRMLTLKASHLVYTRVKAEESCGITVFLPYALRETMELIMQIPPEYFFLPIGSRSLPRLILKYFGVPPALYLQFKSGFSTTVHILRDSEISLYMKNFVNKCWASMYVKIDKLTPFEIHNLFNVCLVTSP
jgi:asparagine synthetase B (glutamine-hydrolysing)